MKPGDRVKYTGNITGEARGKTGVVLDRPTHLDNHVFVRFDGESFETTYMTRNLTLINEVPMTNKIDLNKPIYAADTGDLLTVADRSYAPGKATLNFPPEHPAACHWRAGATKPIDLVVKLDTGEVLSSPQWKVTNTPPVTVETRIRYGLASGATLSDSIEKVRSNYSRASQFGIIEYTQEKHGDLWQTVSVAMAPTEEYKFFDMNMQPLTDAPTDASHIKVTMMAGIVSNTEIVHP